MKITWVEIQNVKEYVEAMLGWQADDIPQELIQKGTWVQKQMNVDDIQPDLAMVSDHDNDPIHIKRRDSFIESVKAGAPILPLIVLNCSRGERYLVDGYARYRALKAMEITDVSVLQQDNL